MNLKLANKIAYECWDNNKPDFAMYGYKLDEERQKITLALFENGRIKEAESFLINTRVKTYGSAN